MILILSEQIDRLFSSTSPQQSAYDYLADRALSRGIDLYQAKNFSGAAAEFRKSVVLSPFSANSDKAYEYLAFSYLSQNNTAEAINTYKQMIKRNPSNDSAHLSLGNIYFKAGQYKEAEAEYTMAVRTNLASAANRYALGQTYLITERYSEAESQFRRVVQITPRDPNAYDALGQALRKLDRLEDAAYQFNKALQFDKNYADAYLGLGYVYTDMQKTDEAAEQADRLSKLDKQKAADLNEYIKNAADPKITSVFSTSGFPLTAGRNTRVSTIDDSLELPNGSKDFTLTFIFSKEMDVSSVTNPLNWQISRATGKDPGGAYNWGLPIPSTEVSLPAAPYKIAYTEGSLIAEVTFKIKQNSAANGTIDPSRMVFKFRGLDAYGNAMDPSADEYSSVSKIV
jgi:tetratricopeptide (TPR) repeat protein